MRKSFHIDPWFYMLSHVHMHTHKHGHTHTSFKKLTVEWVTLRQLELRLQNIPEASPRELRRLGIYPLVPTLPFSKCPPRTLTS